MYSAGWVVTCCFGLFWVFLFFMQDGAGVRWGGALGASSKVKTLG